MGIKRLDLPRKRQGNKGFYGCLSLSFFIMFNIGCTRADPPGVYRESKGKVARFTVELTDQALMIAAPFIKLEDGSVIDPTLYFYQLREGFLLGVSKVERSGRTFRSIGRDSKAIYRAYYLPVSEEIDTYLILVRKGFHKDSVPKYVNKTERNPTGILLGYKSDYVLANWQLLEIPAKDISPEKPIVIPAYEELAKRELTKEKKELLEDLVQRYEKASAAARKRMVTPVGAKPMDCDAPRKPGTYLKGCGEVISVSVRLSDPVIRVARFVRLQDGSVLRPTLVYYRGQEFKNAEENENGFLTLGPEEYPKNWRLDLPESKEIAGHLLLVRRSYPKDAVPEYVKEVEQDPISKKRNKKQGTQPDHVWANWQLLEFSTEDIKPFVIPSYETLAKHELTKEKKELLKDLVQRHEKAAAAARKRAATPVKPGDKRPGGGGDE